MLDVSLLSYNLLFYGGIAVSILWFLISGTYDPNYQTLAAVGGDVFGGDKKQAAAPFGGGGGAPGGGPVAPKPGAGGMAGKNSCMN